jgi:phage gp36-like protein
MTMAYATQGDVAARLAPELFVLLADDDGDGAADQGVIAAALTDAAAEIDQALGGRYVTPLENAPDVARRWCVDLAVERLFARKREAIGGEHAAAAALARRALEAIAAGAANLAGAQPRLADLAGENTERGEEPAFGDEELGLF